MEKGGFKNNELKTVYLMKMSVRGWLTGSGLPRVIQEKIYRLYKDAADYFKNDYNMIEKDNDCLIDMKMIIFVGRK